MQEKGQEPLIDVIDVRDRAIFGTHLGGK